MEPIINQAPAPMPKNKAWLWVVLIILATLLAGGGVYYWQSLETRKIVKNNEENATNTNNEWQTKLNEANDKITALENNLNTEKEKNNQLVDYKNFIDNIQFQYPGLWNISAEKDGWLFSGTDGHFWLKINDNNPKFNANNIKEDYYKNDTYGYQYEDSLVDVAGVQSYKQARYDLGVIERYFIPKNNKIFNLDFEFNFTTPNEEKNKEIKDLINKIISSVKIN